MVAGNPGCVLCDNRRMAFVIPLRKKASAASLPPWRYGVATSSCALGVATVANRSGSASLSERRNQT